MIVNKSMFPLQTGFSVISKMQNQFATLQMQLGSGVKAQTLADMGRDLPVSLSVRSRLTTIEGYNANIEQVALRLSFYDNALTRLDKIEGEARNSAVQGQYGSNNISMATISSLSKARLDEVVTMLNSDIAGRFLFGGKTTDKAPLPTTGELLDGAGGRAGFKAVVSERKAADAGVNDYGRLTTGLDASDPLNVVVTLDEDGVHPFGLKLSTTTQTGSKVTIATDVATDPASSSFTFKADQIGIGESVTIGFTLPDGSESQITMKAVAAATDPLASGEFRVGTNPAATAAGFKSALEGKLKELTASDLAAASTFVASESFFNAAGEPAVRVAGSDPYSATALRVATKTDTVMWYSGETAAVSATGLGRLELAEVSSSPTSMTLSLTEKSPVSPYHGFQIEMAGHASNNVAGASSTFTAGDPAVATMSFGNDVRPQDTVRLTLKEPAPSSKTHEIALVAVSGRAGPGQYTISPSNDPAETAANFQLALQRNIGELAAGIEGNPRQSVSTAIEDAGRVDYGMQANENGYLRLVRSLASMSIETYPEVTNASDPNAANLNPAKARFDAMARRQQSELSEARNSERGSIELVTMQLGVARAALQSAGERHTNYKAQLDNLLSDVETVSKEDVAMEILALQTRLTASYQVTSMVSQLSLVNFL